MHPARSLILFTTLSGLGFGYLCMLGLGVVAATGLTAFFAYALGYGLAGGGLIASTFHLGHPERALKAFTQWRSSWLSREGWLAVLTLVTLAPVALAQIFWQTPLTLLGYVGAGLALLTVFATSMIYAQLKTVPRWNHWTTPAVFLLYSLGGGALLAGAFGLAVPLLLVGGAIQSIAWNRGDRAFAESGSTVGTATGLGSRGKVRLFEPPHTGGNYLTKEMVFQVGRTHARKLRFFGLALASAFPALLVLIPNVYVSVVVAIVAHMIGMMTLRWLFFAEAEHSVGLYYGRTA